MTRIELTAEQISLLQHAEGPIVLVDATGNNLGEVAAAAALRSQFSAEEIADAESRVGKREPGITTAELLARLGAPKTQPCDTP